MLETILRRSLRLARFAAPDPRTIRRVRAIRRSEHFDRTFYLGANPGLNPLYRAFPERHYLLFGEAAGLRPSNAFSPEAYLAQNPDLHGLPSPLVHYVRHGHGERRVARDPSVDPAEPGERPPTLRPPEGPPGADLAAVVHVFYPELWDEIRDALRASGLRLDLFVTVAERGEASRELHARIEREWPEARVVRMPNRGRDILPFVHLVNAGLLGPYRAVCKIHTKRSPHRRDGDVWRRNLIAGLLEPGRVRERLDAFLADEDAAFWIADGQAYEGRAWWGVNEARVRALLRRLEIEVDARALRFPAGSMFWIKPIMLRMVRGLDLRPEEFEIERAQLDGTLAHAFERAMGFVAAAAGMSIRQTSEIDAAAAAGIEPEPLPRPAFVSAFYLPGFHRTPETDAWWGRGHTEWSACARARPLFEGHPQPALPSTLGFYDPRRTEVMGEQAALARAAGIDAFCVHHHWFWDGRGGRRLMEAPMEALLARPEIDFPFYLCWANEAWRREGDGLAEEVLVEQRYAPGFERGLAESVAPFMRDRRHVRPDGIRPRLVVLGPRDLPEPEAAVRRLRAAFLHLGIGEVELGAVHPGASGERPVPEGVFDFWVEMPPRGLLGPDEALGGLAGAGGPPLPLPDFTGLVHDHAALAARATDPARADALPPDTIAGVVPAWDETALRGLDAHLTHGAHPAAFRAWLRALSHHRLARSHRGEVMINAWNDWARRAALEPSERWGHAWLDTLAEWRGVEAAAGNTGFDGEAEPPAAREPRAAHG